MNYQTLNKTNMKKLILSMIAIFAMSMMMSAQTQDPTSLSFSTTEYSKFIKFVSRDTIYGKLTTASDSIWNVYVTKENKAGLKYSIRLDIDKVTGTPKAKYRLFARRHTSDEWTRLDSVSYGASADTTIYFTQVTTSQYYNYFRIQADLICTSTKMASRYLYIRFRFWE